MKQNKVQQLFETLVNEYNLRAIEIDGVMWYSITDLPLSKQTISNAKRKLEKSDVHLKCTKNFIDENTKLVRVSDVTLNVRRNFDSVHNTGEMFGTFAMVNYIIMSSRLGTEYKIGLIQILDEIRANDFYIDENVSNENYEKLKVKYEILTKKCEARNEIVKKCYGRNLVNIKNMSKTTGIDVEFILEHMQKNNWITSKMEVTKKGAYGKIIKLYNKFYLSEEGVKLIQDAHSREVNKDIRVETMKKSGEKIFDK